MKSADDSMPLDGLIQVDDAYWEVSNMAVNEVEVLLARRLFLLLYPVTKKATQSISVSAG